jgi:hypothetical protein
MAAAMALSETITLESVTADAETGVVTVQWIGHVIADGVEVAAMPRTQHFTQEQKGEFDSALGEAAAEYAGLFPQ